MNDPKSTDSHRPYFGIGLALFTMLAWGLLPPILKVLISEVDPITLTWYRFAGSATIIAAVSGRRELQRFANGITLLTGCMLFLAGAGLTANYFLYLKGLDHLTPSVAQIIMQVAPFLVLLGGVFIFGERFSRRQWLGLLALAAGSACFFNQRYSEFHAIPSTYTRGVLLLVSCAVMWAAFILLQKKLVQSFGSRTIMFACYLVGTLVLLPRVSHQSVGALSAEMMLLLIVAILITVSSYLAFTTALRHIEATRAGLFLANVPLVTLLAMLILGERVTRLEPENLNALAIFGAVLVVVGTMLAAINPSRRDEITPVPPE